MAILLDVSFGVSSLSYCRRESGLVRRLLIDVEGLVAVASVTDDSIMTNG